MKRLYSYNTITLAIDRLLLLSLLWEQDGVNIWQYTTLRNCNVSEQLVQLLVVSDGELQVTGDDSRLLVVAGCVSSQLEDFGAEIFQDSGEVDWGTSTDTLGVVSLSQETMDSTNGELKACSR
jgi:hypothetical protein